MKEKNSSFQAYTDMIETVLSDEIDVAKKSLRRKGMFLQQNVFSAKEFRVDSPEKRTYKADQG